MKIASLFVALFVSTSIFAQGTKDARINEILVKNSSCIIDNFGKNSGWIEIRNSGYSTFDFGGCYLREVTVQGDTTTHVIPKGLVYTTVAPQNYLIIYLSEISTSPLTTNFTLEDAKELLIYDASGKNIIDRVELDPALLDQDISLIRPAADVSSRVTRESEADLATRDAKMVISRTTTPRNSNFPAPLESRAEAFRRVDKSGGGMAVIAMSVVFLALIALFLVFQQVGNAMQRMARKKEAQKNPAPATTSSSAPAAAPVELNGEVLAAIGYAIKMYTDEMNASEARVLTINRTTKAYSPWSSKIHGLTQTPPKK